MVEHGPRCSRMKLVLVGTDLPGRAFCDPHGAPLDNVHVGVQAAGHFRMFRRAKLMLSRVDQDLICGASNRGLLYAQVRLTDDRGGPRCARVDPPAISWIADDPSGTLNY